MAHCTTCYNLTKKAENHLELNLEFTINQLKYSAVDRKCSWCLIIWKDLRQMRWGDWELFKGNMRTLYVRCLGDHRGFAETLQLVVTFIDDSPSMQLEFYSLEQHGTFLWNN
jgi:hypothetical protein